MFVGFSKVLVDSLKNGAMLYSIDILLVIFLATSTVKKMRNRHVNHGPWDEPNHGAKTNHFQIVETYTPEITFY